MRQLAPWFLLAPSIALAGGLVEDPTRVTLWAVAIAVDVAGTLTVGRAGFRVSPSHFAERYALFIIIALGESIVAIGVGSAELEKDAAFAGAVAIAFAGVAALWWGYFDFAQTGAERTLRRTPAERRGALARDVFTFFHYPIVAGIILFAVAAKKTLAHPEDALSGAGRFALGAGIAVFLLGFVLARLRAIRRVAWERIGGAVAAAVLCAALTDLAAAALLAVVVAVLAAVYAFEAVRLRELRAQLRSEP
jgi:low temperature requirement protein LtrA